MNAHSRIVGIIQARMSSTRLPGKVMMELAGQPMLHHVVERARRAIRLADVMVATTVSPADDELASYCARANITCFRGSEDDVLDRYYRAAQSAGASVVVRLTADCPLLDPGVIDRVMSAFEEGGHDYVSNTLTPTYPDGLDTEVFSRDALERAWHEAELKSEREHVTPYIYKHPKLFRLRNVSNDEDLSALRWTVDEPRDLDFVRAVYDHFGAAFFGLTETLAFVRARPDLGTVNAGIARNEGYARSLAEDHAKEEG